MGVVFGFAEDFPQRQSQTPSRVGKGKKAVERERERERSRQLIPDRLAKINGQKMDVVVVLLLLPR